MKKMNFVVFMLVAVILVVSMIGRANAANSGDVTLYYEDRTDGDDVYGG